MDALKTTDHAEAVAVFRSEVVGSLCRRELSHGDLMAELRALASERFRLPGASITKTISVPTLERWYYAYRKGGLSALRPRPRSDRGRARALPAETRELLLAIRRENPSASVPLILGTLVHDGRLDRGAVSAATVRRLFADHGLDRVAIRDGSGTHTRLRWQAERPGALWHGDVCHGQTLVIGGQNRPLRIHGMLDDHSRFVVALEAMHSEREIDILGLLCRAVRPPPSRRQRLGQQGKRLPDSFRLTYCHNVTLGRRDFYRQLCTVLGLAPSATAAAVFHAVSSHVSEMGNDRVHPVFLLDEAHLLNQDTLDHLHILLNYDWDSRALLSLVLVGLPELLDRLTWSCALHASAATATSSPPMPSP